MEPLLPQVMNTKACEAVIGFPVDHAYIKESNYGEDERSKPVQKQNRDNNVYIPTLTDNILFGLSEVLIVVCVIGMILILMGYMGDKKEPFECQIDSLTIFNMTVSPKDTNSSTTNTTENYMIANLNLRLTIINQRPGTFESLGVSTRYSGEILSSTELEPFYQQDGHSKTMQVEMGVDDVRVSEDTANAIGKESAKQGALNFSVNVDTQYWNLEEGNKYLCWFKVACDGIKVLFNSSNDIVGPGIWSMRGPAIPCNTSPVDC